MKYISAAKIAKKWKVSERTVRNYCAEGRVLGALLKGKIWHIPSDSLKPGRKNKFNELPLTLLDILKREQEAQIRGGIYHKIQVDLTYNSNHMEGSRLTHNQTRYIFETNTIGIEKGEIKADDIVETSNHFKCIDLIIKNANYKLSEHFIKTLHATLKNGTSDSRKNWFIVGDYKRLPNEVGGNPTTAPEHISREIRALLKTYNKLGKPCFEDLLDFHYKFEKIHPFQDGNGRIGRLILFKECLKNNIVPFIITDDIKRFYYMGLQEWPRGHERLRDTCLAAQDQMKAILDYFKISYANI